MCRTRISERVVKVISLALILAAVYLYFTNSTGKRLNQDEPNKKIGKYTIGWDSG